MGITLKALHYYCPPTWVNVVHALAEQSGQRQLLHIFRRKSHPAGKVRRRSAVDDRPSIYFLVLDSVSRLTLRRHLPQTYALLTQARDKITAKGTSELPDNLTNAAISVANSDQVLVQHRLSADASASSNYTLPPSHSVISFSRYHTLIYKSTRAQLTPMVYGGLGCFVTRFDF